MIEIKDLNYRFPDGTLGLENINLSIKQGEFVIIAGSNGSGKSTLCRHLNGLNLPTSGSITINGMAVSKNLSKIRQLVGMVFQDADSQIVGETVLADTKFGPENLRLKREMVTLRAVEALKKVGMYEMADHRPHTLSGGEKRRLALAGVLAMKPKIIVFDEPFSNLDYPASKQLLQQILEFSKAGHTILIVTHDLEKVIAYADRLVIMEKGKLIKSGKPIDLVDQVENYGVREPHSFKMGKGLMPWLNQ